MDVPPLVDAHVHLDMYPAADLAGVVAEIEEHRVLTLSTAVDPASYESARRIAGMTDLVVAGFGIHPWEAHRFADSLSDLDPLLDLAPFIGEIGLDHRWVEDPGRFPAQRIVFDHQLAAAARLGKMINIHTAGAERESLELVTQHGVEQVIVHWYSGPLDVLGEMIEAGFFFTVGVQVLSSDVIREIARRIPIDRLLTETDNPGGLEWITGDVGRPAVVSEVLDELARIREVSRDDLARAVSANAASIWPQP